MRSSRYSPCPKCAKKVDEDMGSGHSNGDASSNASNKTMVCYEEVPSLDVDPETESFIFEEGYTISKKIGEGSYGKVKSLSFLLACVSQR